MMGLSDRVNRLQSKVDLINSMIESKERQLKYALHYYVSPSFGSWHEWFAWHPVRVVTFQDVSSHGEVWNGYYARCYKWMWLKTVARRKVTDYLDGPGRENAGSKKYYEYTTLMDLLTHG